MEGLQGTDTAAPLETEALMAGEAYRTECAAQPDSADTAVDPLQAYLDDISAIPLLSPDEEKTLAEKARQGIEVRKSLGQKGLQGKEAEELRQLDTRGKIAGRLLFQANLRLVVYLSKRYRWSKMSPLDPGRGNRVGAGRARIRGGSSRGSRGDHAPRAAPCA